MGLETLVVAWVLTQSPDVGCVKDSECKGERICEDGRCVSPPEPAVSAPAIEAPLPPRFGSAFLDPAGFLVFGPTLGVEAGVDRVTGTLYARWFSGGLLSSILFLGPGDKYDFSYGLGVRGRFYFHDGFQGAHVGLGVEWVRTQVENSIILLVLSTNLIVPQLEGGYRWGWRYGYVGLAGSAGYAVRFGWRTDNLPGGNRASTTIPGDPSSVFFAAKLELGVYF